MPVMPHGSIVDADPADLTRDSSSLVNLLE